MPAELRDQLDRHFRTAPVLALLGIEVLSWGAGSAQLRLATRPEHANLAGTVHGGLLFALADAAFEAACNSEGRVCVALETACHYTAPTPVGDVLVAAAAEVSRTRRTASYRIDVRDADQQLRAWYMALAYRTDRWHFGAERWPEDWRAGH